MISGEHSFGLSVLSSYVLRSSVYLPVMYFQISCYFHTSISRLVDVVRSWTGSHISSFAKHWKLQGCLEVSYLPSKVGFSVLTPDAMMLSNQSNYTCGRKWLYQISPAAWYQRLQGRYSLFSIWSWLSISSFWSLLDSSTHTKENGRSLGHWPFAEPLCCRRVCSSRSSLWSLSRRFSCL